MSTSITKTPVILWTYKDQEKQIELIKTALLKHSIQVHKNLSTLKSILPQPTKLVRPIPGSIRQTLVAADTLIVASLSIKQLIKFLDLLVDKYNYFRTLNKDYAYYYKTYNQQIIVIVELRIRILEIVYTNNLYYTFNYDFVYQILSNPKQRFALTDQAYEQELIID